MHIDYITIPGATIKNLHHAFISEFKGAYCPVDVLLVGGVNDVLQGRTAEQVLADILNFKISVLSMNQDLLECRWEYRAEQGGGGEG